MKLDKKYVYSLEDLTSEELNQLLEKLIELDNTWEGESPKEELFTSNFLYFSDDYKAKGEWLVSDEMYFTTKKTVNAKELFVPQQEVTDKPKHYSKGIDTFARMEANCTKEECLAFAKGNIDKYNFRTKGQDLEDLEKIIAYSQWAIKLLKDEK